MMSVKELYNIVLDIQGLLGDLIHRLTRLERDMSSNNSSTNQYITGSTDLNCDCIKCSVNLTNQYDNMRQCMHSYNAILEESESEYIFKLICTKCNDTKVWRGQKPIIVK